MAKKFDSFMRKYEEERGQNLGAISNATIGLSIMKNPEKLQEMKKGCSKIANNEELPKKVREMFKKVGEILENSVDELIKGFENTLETSMQSLQELNQEADYQLYQRDLEDSAAIVTNLKAISERIAKKHPNIDDSFEDLMEIRKILLKGIALFVGMISDNKEIEFLSELIAEMEKQQGPISKKKDLILDNLKEAIEGKGKGKEIEKTNITDEDKGIEMAMRYIKCEALHAILLGLKHLSEDHRYKITNKDYISKVTQKIEEDGNSGILMGNGIMYDNTLELIKDCLEEMKIQNSNTIS